MVDGRDRRRAGAPSGGDLATHTGRGLLPPEVRALDGAQRLGWILELPSPGEFVAQLAPEQLHLLIADIGPNDAYALLEYADAWQLGRLIDLDAWKGNELQLDRWFTWLDRALAVDIDTGLRFIRATETELLELALCSDGIQVHNRDLELDTVPDALELFETPDGMYWVAAPREHPLCERMPQLLKLLWAADMGRAREIFQALRFELPSDVEESALRFRNARINEMGFPAPSDALEIYRAGQPERLRREIEELAEGSEPGRPLEGRPIVQEMALREVEAPPLMARALAALDEEQRDHFAEGMSYLVNALFMARVRDLSRTDELPDAARFAAALTNLGLEIVSDGSVDLAARILSKVWARKLFELGHSLTVELSIRARRLRRRAGAQYGLYLFGSPLDDALEALANRPTPSYFEGLEAGGSPVWSPFTTLDQLGRARQALDKADAILGFCEERLGFSPRALLTSAQLDAAGDDERRLARLATLLRTAIAQALLGDELSFEPLSRSDLGAFLAAAFDGGELAQPLVDVLERVKVEAPAPIRAWIDESLAELVAALSHAASQDVDPRFALDLFLIRREDVADTRG